MATVDKYGKPLVLPICFVYDDTYFYSPIDRKPKSVPARNLKRIRNIGNNPSVSVVIDHYEDNWSNLYYIIIEGKAELLYSGHLYRNSLKLLTDKYDQYRVMDLQNLGAPVIKIEPLKIISWGD